MWKFWVLFLIRLTLKSALGLAWKWDFQRILPEAIFPLPRFASRPLSSLLINRLWKQGTWLVERAVKIESARHLFPSETARYARRDHMLDACRSKLQAVYTFRILMTCHFLYGFCQVTKSIQAVQWYLSKPEDSVLWRNTNRKKTPFPSCLSLYMKARPDAQLTLKRNVQVLSTVFN